MIRTLRFIRILRMHAAARFTALLLASGSACAQTASAANAANAELPGVSTGSMLQVMLGLLLILGLLFAAATFLRKFNGGRAFGGNGPMRLVGGLMIGTRERIVLIEVGDDWLVVGITPGQIRTLHTMPKGELPPAAAGDKSFGKMLKQMIDGKHEGH